MLNHKERFTHFTNGIFGNLIRITEKRANTQTLLPFHYIRFHWLIHCSHTNRIADLYGIFGFVLNFIDCANIQQPKTYLLFDSISKLNKTSYFFSFSPLSSVILTIATLHHIHFVYSLREYRSRAKMFNVIVWHDEMQI